MPNATAKIADIVMIETSKRDGHVRVFIRRKIS